MDLGFRDYCIRAQEQCGTELCRADGNLIRESGFLAVVWCAERLRRGKMGDGEVDAGTPLFAVFVVSLLSLFLIPFTIYKLCNAASSDRVVKPWEAVSSPSRLQVFPSLSSRWTSPIFFLDINLISLQIAADHVNRCSVVCRYVLLSNICAEAPACTGC